jgi:AcrR family transcriptional regulator
MTTHADSLLAAPIPLAGGELRGARHVCGLFVEREEGYRGLLPFVIDGLARGERAVHIVDPATREEHLERLAHAGIDVPSELDSGRLEVTTWEGAYLRGGRFDLAAMVSFVREALAEGRSRGFPLTRIIGYMEWALVDVPGVNDLVAYESAIDVVLRDVPDPVICVYDLPRHSAGPIVRILGAHPVAIVDGRLLPRVSAPMSPRDRILLAASELFSRQGIGPTGVDSLIKSAGVAKATFYRHFPSKADLIVAWLLDGRSRWFEPVRRRAEARAHSPRELIPSLFEATAEWLEAGDFRGCPFLNTAAEIVDPDHAARPIVRDYLLEIQAGLRGALASAGHDDAAALAPQLQAMLAGGISLAVAHRSTDPMLAARDAAARWLHDGARDKAVNGA